MKPLKPSLYLLKVYSIHNVMFLYNDMTILTIAPPSITELMYDGFTCDVSLEVISLEISWTVSMIYTCLSCLSPDF